MVRFSFLIILLFLSALFSGSETAFFSLPPWRVRRLAKEGRRWAILAETLLSSPERLLITIILGNEAVNITLSTIAAGIRRDFLPGLGSFGFTLGVAATSLVLLIFGEVTPKVIAMRDPEGWGRRFTRFIKGISVLFSPFSLLLSPLLLLLAKRKKERVMIDGIFSLSELTVAEVMTPRTQIIAVKENISADALFRFVSQFPYSRYPVYLKDLDDIKGILYAKDLLAYKFGFPPRGRWQRLIRPPFFLPETPSLSEAFQLMRKRRTTIAIVVDEYGGTAGLITMEDIMRKLVGRREEFIYEKRGDEYLLAGRAPLPLLSSEFGRRIEDEYSATLAGYLLNLAGRLLREGDIVEDDHFRYQVIETDGARIVKVNQGF